MKQCGCNGCHNENGAAVIEKDSCACGEESGEHDHGHEHGHDHGSGELSTTRQDIISIIFAAALALSSALIPNEDAKTTMLAAALLIAGWPIFLQGLKNIFRLEFEEMSLMTIAVVAAACIGELPEGLMVTVLFRIGQLLEDIAVARGRREVEAVTNIIPDNANLLSAEGVESAVSARTLKVGDIIRIKSGERVPVDCTVISGESSVDSSSLTGESAPRDVQKDDALLSGMVNLGGVLTCEATNTFDNSTASKIVEMVREASAKKGVTERMISRFARVYTPCVIVAAIAVAILPPLLGFGGFTTWIGRSLVFLVASCPCALVIATPLSFFAGIGGCSKQGILVKGSKFIEALAKADAVVFDKTGTLTTGRLSVDEIYAVEGSSNDEVLRLATICESDSNHPIAKAIVAAGPKDFAKAAKSEEITSYGMRAQVDDDEVLCGSKRLMERFDVDVSALPQANVYVAKNGRAIGAISVFDAPRGDAAESIAKLAALGVSRTAMLTGDAQGAAEKTANLIGLTDVFANLLPQDKVARFESIKALTPGKTLFVGDGINDSPVLAASDAGVAMGVSSDAAIEAADVVLLSDRLSSLPQAISIAKRTSGLAAFNIAFALTVKLAVFVLAFLGVAGMWLAVFADVGVTIISVLNATRALRFK